MGEAVNVRIDPLLDALFEKGASDLLLKVGARPALRMDGQLEAMTSVEPLTADQTHSLAEQLLSPDHRSRLDSGGTVDFSFEWKDQGRVRGNAFKQRGTIALALRSIPTGIPTFEELRLPAITRKLVELPRGLILLTGPTGAGKSTTQASMLDWINGARAQHIITIEDPIEYVHSDRRCLVEQREVGVDTPDFADALRSALREDPDVMLVGEMRDLESIRIALNIAETGHLVFATLHTNDTTQALNRIVDVFPGDQQQQIRVQLAASLQAVIYQQLLPLRHGGRAAAFEVLLGTPAVRALLRDNKSAQLRNVIVTNRAEGMQTLERSLSEMVAEGLVTWDDAVAVSLYPKEVERPERPPKPVPPPPPPPRSFRHPEPV
ncbi:MAG: type IV pilus twitching motility protein PilT [Candidatus Dormibacteria bacterium]